MTHPEKLQAISLPEGYKMRPPTMDDLEATVALMNRLTLALYGTEDESIDEMRLDWQRPDIPLTQTRRIVENATGEIIGYISANDALDPPVTVSGWALVDPDYHNLGIEDVLVNWAIEHGRAAIARCPDDARVVVRLGVEENYAPTVAAYERAGMTEVRHFFEMQIDRPDDIQAPVMPDGFVMRVVNHEDDDDFRQTIAALDEAFKDHWGHVDRPLDKLVEIWRHYCTGEDFRADWWRVAVDTKTGEIAGGVVMWHGYRNSDKNAYISTVGVRRAYRRRGLAKAMLLTAFNMAWEAGMQSVMLHVDATSLTGATRLYERAGMRVTRHGSSYELELRPGRDYTTSTIDE